jgi:1-acyl-sn-glycerol-3-phosphate acyltransferase
LGKEEFLARLEAAVEGKTAELVSEATGHPVTPAVRVLAPDEAARVAKAGLRPGDDAAT